MDEIDWGSRVPAYVGLVLSLLALWRGRTSVKVSLGIRDKDEEIWVTNMSPHEVEIVSLGAVKADGSLSDWFDGPDPWPGLPKRVPARSQVVIKRIRPAKSPTQPRKAKTWCALKFKWAPALAF
ncbi:hypothetical protein [Pseudomonas syringae]|uniref:hypothetical protein n=1 Tax=Pseudomonas syringae TaxID=317 RepID=UPI003F7527A4